MYQAVVKVTTPVGTVNLSISNDLQNLDDAMTIINESQEAISNITANGGVYTGYLRDDSTVKFVGEVQISLPQAIVSNSIFAFRVIEVK